MLRIETKDTKDQMGAHSGLSFWCFKDKPESKTFVYGLAWPDLAMVGISYTIGNSLRHLVNKKLIVEYRSMHARWLEGLASVSVLESTPVPNIGWIRNYDISGLEKIKLPAMKKGSWVDIKDGLAVRKINIERLGKARDIPPRYLTFCPIIYNEVPKFLVMDEINSKNIFAILGCKQT
jgi:hypothetical protein